MGHAYVTSCSPTATPLLIQMQGYVAAARTRRSRRTCARRYGELVALGDRALGRRRRRGLELLRARDAAQRDAALGPGARSRTTRRGRRVLGATARPVCRAEQGERSRRRGRACWTAAAGAVLAALPRRRRARRRRRVRRARSRPARPSATTSTDPQSESVRSRATRSSARPGARPSAGHDRARAARRARLGRRRASASSSAVLRAAIADARRSPSVRTPPGPRAVARSWCSTDVAARATCR